VVAGNVHADLRQLSYGSVTAKSYGRYDVNGFRFRSIIFEDSRPPMARASGRNLRNFRRRPTEVTLLSSANFQRPRADGRQVKADGKKASSVGFALSSIGPLPLEVKQFPIVLHGMVPQQPGGRGAH
jgi:hypothetical protein